MPKIQKILIACYVGILVFSFFYVQSVLKSNTLDIKQKDTTKKVTSKNITVYFNILDGANSQQLKFTKKNTDNVAGIIETLFDKKNIKIAITAHSYGDVIDAVNNITAPQGYDWKIRKNTVDILTDFSKTDLADGDIFDLLLIQTAKPQ